MPWDVDIKNMADHADGDFKQKRDRIVVSTLSDVVLSSPVDTGAFRGRWSVSLRPQSISSRLDKAGGTTINKGVSDIRNIVPYTVVYLSNSVPYAEKLEGGSSPQARDGILKPAYSRLVARFSS